MDEKTVARRIAAVVDHLAGAEMADVHVRYEFASFRFAQSVQGIALTVIGMSTRKELEQNVDWARNFKPMAAQEANDLRKRTVALAKEWGVHLDRLDSQGERSRPLINT